MIFYVGNQPDPKDRVKIDVDDADSDALILTGLVNGRKPYQVTVFDQITQKNVTVADEACGLGCRCALRFVEPAND